MTRATLGREIILDALLEILEKGGMSHRVLGQALDKYQYLEKQDRAFITRVVEGTVEYRLTLDAVLSECSSVKVEKMKPVIRTILRMSAYQIMMMDRIPDSAVCDEAVKLAAGRHLQGLKGFVNGVLRTVSRRKDSFVFADWTRRYSMPEWLIDLWKKQYGAQTTERMLQAFLADTPTTVRCNENLAPMETIRASLAAQGVEAEASPLLPQMLMIRGYDSIGALEAFRKGWIQVQDASSGLVGELAAVQPGDRILDVCGAPGGKALHLADKLNGTGLVTVRDLSEGKIRLVEENLARSGFTNVRTEVWDARVPDERLFGQMDLVLADLPCSGLGIIGKKPDIKYQVTPEKLDSLAALQREILSVAARYVRPGGRLIYSTCTVNPQENEQQQKWFLEHEPFTAVDFSGSLGAAVAEESMKDGWLQLLPGRHPCDGFFIAVFRRNEDRELQQV